MKYIKDAKKTKTRVYILVDKHGRHTQEEVLNCSKSDRAGYYWEHKPSGRRFEDWYDAPKDIQNELVSSAKYLVRDFNYQQVYPFIFSADFKIVGSGSTSAYTEVLKFEEILPKNTAMKTKPFQPGITPGNFVWLFTDLLTRYPQDFKMRQENGEFIFSGIWKFELNKNSICVVPHVEDYKEKGEREDDWDN